MQKGKFHISLSSTIYHIPHTNFSFTIAKLLISIVVICIIAAFTVFALSSLISRDSTTSLTSDLKNASNQLELDKTSSSGKYPSTKELANNGAGLKSSPDVTLKYTYNDSSNYYCLLATNSNGVSYYISSTRKTPIIGTCPPVLSNSFVVAWGGTHDDEQGRSLVQTSDGGYAVTGTTTGLDYGAGNYDMILAKYAPDGTLSWSKTWGGTGGDDGYSLVQTSDGGYAVTGETSSYGAAGGLDMFLAKYTSDGTLSWSKTWGGTSWDWGISLVQTSDGGYAVTGTTIDQDASTTNMFLAKYTSDGTLSWNKTWGGTYGNFGGSLVQTSDGGYAVTGGTSSGDILLAKYTSDGTLSWNKTWGGTGNDEGHSIVQTSDGGYAVTGKTNSYGAGMYDMFIAKYTSDGILSWSKTWGGIKDNDGDSLVQADDGGYAVTGKTDSYGAGSTDMFLAKYTSDGTLSWNKTWGGTGYDTGSSLVQTSDGGYAVTGKTDSYGAGGGGDMFLAKFKSDGTIVGCSSPMCQSPTVSVSSLSATITSPTASVSSLSATITSPTASVSSPKLTSTIIIAP